MDLHGEDLNPVASLGGFYSNNDLGRAESFRIVLQNTSTKAIWAGIGGFGSAEVMEIFDQNGWTFPGKIIPIIGFSDITTLHLAAHVRGWPSLHAPMANLLKETTETSGITSVGVETSVAKLMQCLKGEITEVSYELNVLNPDVLSSFNEEINTKVIGGNLSVIQRSNGTSARLNGTNSVIFFEDTPEAFNRFHSLLTSIARAVGFDNATAIFFGDFTITGGPSLEETVCRFEKDILRGQGLNIPILQASGFGHSSINEVLPLGTKSTLQFTQDGKAILKCSVNQSGY